jgi:hypothetical protein
MINPTIDEFGNLHWYNDKGQYHREGMPAFIHIDGLQSYWLNGKVHRTDGPAVISKGRYKWWINDKIYISNKYFQEAAGITDEDMTAIILKYGNVK